MGKKVILIVLGILVIFIVGFLLTRHFYSGEETAESLGIEVENDCYPFPEKIGEYTCISKLKTVPVSTRHYAFFCGEEGEFIPKVVYEISYSYLNANLEFKIAVPENINDAINCFQGQLRMALPETLSLEEFSLGDYRAFLIEGFTEGGNREKTYEKLITCLDKENNYITLENNGDSVEMLLSKEELKALILDSKLQIKELID